MNASHTTCTPGATHEADRREDDVISRLKSSQLFRDYQEAFETATNLPLVLRAVGSFDAPLHGSKQISSFCALMAGANRACRACLGMQAEMESTPITETRTLQCFAGLSESMVPIRLGEKVIGYLQTGQVLLRPPTEKTFRVTLAELEKWKTVVDVGQLRTAFFETRVLTKARYGAVLRLLMSFAQHLSLLSNELMIAQTTAEPPAIAKARAFIAEKLGEELSLEQVARAANTSPFYFCKIFKTATGLTFTDYVARARIEKTKEMLLNPHTRISEAAYAAGFQSLSQFNRVFRRVAGESPTVYREHLHQTTEARRPARLAFAA
jgi:AraC-like DNA-binding protein/ligand-binding sensor protein